VIRTPLLHIGISSDFFRHLRTIFIMAAPFSLPQWLVDLWSLTDEDLLATLSAERSSDLNVSSLLKLYLAFLHEHHVQDDFREPKPRSLKSTALEGIVKELNTSPDILNSAKEITLNLHDVLLRELLWAPSMRYPVLRACISAAKNRLGDCQSSVDIDELLLTNERYIRSKMDQISDDSHLMSLEDFCTMLSIDSNDEGFGLLHRPSLPDGGAEFRNSEHQDSLLIRTSSAQVAAVLEQDISDHLGGLDWENVLMVGDPVMRAVMFKEVAPDQFCRGQMWYKPIELYIYGVSVEEANQKVRQIHDVWANNFSAAGEERTVVKDGAHVTFLASTSIRPIWIRSMLFRSRTEALLCLGPGAVGFDGSRKFYCRARQPHLRVLRGRHPVRPGSISKKISLTPWNDQDGLLTFNTGRSYHVAPLGTCTRDWLFDFDYGLRMELHIPGNESKDGAFDSTC